MNEEHDPADPTWDLTDPIDLTAVHLDDRFLDALSDDKPVPTRDDTEYHLAELLAGWRHDVIAEPLPELPTVEEVESAIAATERARRGRGVIRHLRVASGAAAIVVIAGAGLTVLAEGSSPGDPLWGVKRVVFAEAASQTQASMDVQSYLEQAEAAAASGDTAQAAELIAKAQKNMGPVADADKKRMNEWIDRLRTDGASKAASSSSSKSSASRDSSVTGRNPNDPASPPRDLLKSGTDNRSTSVTVPNPPPPTDDQSSDPPTDARTGQPGTGQPGTTDPQLPSTTDIPVPTTTPVPTANPSPVEPEPTVSPELPTITTTLLPAPAPARWYW